eukprot:IDg6908t1
MSRVFTVLDTGVSRNLVRVASLPKIREGHIRLGLSCDIRDANRLIRVVSKISLIFHVGTKLLQDDFLICERLAAPFILGTPFMNRNVRSIQPPERRIQIADLYYEPIVRHTFDRRMRRIPQQQQASLSVNNQIRIPQVFMLLNLDRISSDTIQYPKQTVF